MNNSVEKLTNHYTPRLKKYQESFRILDWESMEAQTARFQVLLDNVSLDGASILDVGCGCGDLYELIRKNTRNTDYTGIDILPEMVEKAKDLHRDTRFLCGDLFSSSSVCSSRYDIIYASGIFNLNLGNNAVFFEKAVKTFRRMADKYIVITLLDEASPDPDEKYFYFNPEDAAKRAGGEGFSVNIIRGYLDNDFTLVCAREKN